MTAESSTPLRILGSLAAGAVGFVFGFYAGFFILLSALGLDASGLAFVVVAGGLGVIGAAFGMALSVRSGRKRPAVVVTVVLGALLLLGVHLMNGDFGVLMIGGALLVVVVAALVRTGATDVLAGRADSGAADRAVASPDGSVHPKTAEG